jgi:hypothetical protein
VTPPAKRVEVQFVIERACPHGYSWPHGESVVKTINASAPFSLWVWWPPDPPNRTSSDPCTDSASYMLSPRGLAEADLIFQRKVHRDSYICSHMGHVIE